MRKVLLLTLATGAGHNYAAGSLREKLESEGFEAELLDPFRSGDRLLDVLVSGGYNTMAKRSPTLYGKIYRLAEKDVANETVINLIKRKGLKNLLSQIDDRSPDLIISTHPILTFLLGAAREEERLTLPVMAVVTDYIGHYTYMAHHGGIDAYITGSAFTKRDLIRRGVPEHKVFTYGIPIRQEFYQPRPCRPEGDLFTVLVMAGSMGLTKMEKVIGQVMGCPQPLRMVAVCGNNEEMREDLEKTYGQGMQADGKEVVIYGFTREVARLMDEADLMITKPGGLTVSEAIAKRMPLLIPYMIPGQEEENANLLETEGAAVRVERIREVGPMLTTLMQRPDLLETMQRNLGHLAQAHSLQAVVQKAWELTEKEPVVSGGHPVDVLILTGGFSRGYGDAARALQEELQASGRETQTLPLLQKLSPGLHRKMKRSYLRYLHTMEPLYDLLGLGRRIRPNLMDSLGLRVYLPLFARWVEPYKPRLLVTFFYPWVFLGAHYKRKVNPWLKLVAFIPEVPEDRKFIHREVDAYLVPHEAVARRLEELGADPQKIHRAAFPLPQAFSKSKALAFRQSLLEDTEAPVLVLLGEEEAWLPREESFYQWLADSGFHTVVLTGENRWLEKLVSRDSFSRIVPVRSVDDLADLIGAGDLVVGRPYTIATYEALAADVPFIGYCPDEEKRFMSAPHGVRTVQDAETLTELLGQWLESEPFREELGREVAKRRDQYREDTTYAEVIGRLLAGQEDAGPEKGGHQDG